VSSDYYMNMKTNSNMAQLKTFVHEAVPGFMKGGKQNAENLVNNMIPTLKDKGVSLSELRSYEVDSTVNVVGTYPGIQAQLL